MMSMVNFRRGSGEPKQPQVVPTMAQPRERQLHPAAQAAAAEYSAVWTENDFLRNENQRLKNEIDVARKVDEEKSALISDLRVRVADAQTSADERVDKIETHFRERLADAERAKERYLRYAVGIRERLKACREMITTADAEALEMAHNEPANIDQEIKGIIAGLTKRVEQ
jgi:hypothetical protein